MFSDDDGVRVLLVDDGSGVAEQEALVRVIEPVVTGRALFLPPLLLPENLGKGGAVYSGWRKNTGEELLAFVDADRSITASEVNRVLELAKTSARPTAFFGSRVKMLGRRVERQFKRHLIGRIFATLVSEILGIPVYDSQCGFKVVPRAVFESVASKLTIRRFAFDVDLLVQLTDAGLPVVEVPIDWQEEPGGKVRLIRDSWRMFRDILTIRERRQDRR